MAFTISLIERGPPQLVQLADWIEHDLDPAMRALAAESIVRLTNSAAGILVAPSHYVGEMRISGAVVKIAPKSPALFTAMESLAVRAIPKIGISVDRKFTMGREEDDALLAFIGALSAALTAGLPWLYGYSSEATSYPSGKLQVSATISRFSSRGIYHRVVAKKVQRVQRENFVRVVRSAHSLLSTLSKGRTERLAQADMLMAAFDPAPIFEDLSLAIAAGDDLLGECDLTSTSKELIVQSLAILRRQLVLAGATYLVPGGAAYFQNLERLWELCVLRFTQQCPEVRRGGAVDDHGLHGSGLRLFSDGGPRIDPDVVVRNGRAVTAVIDAKYKRRDAQEGTAGDLYQLACYVRSTNAAVGILVYFSEENAAASFVGTSIEGAVIISVSLTPSIILSDGESALASCIASHSLLAQRVQECFANRASYQRANSISDLAGDVLFRP